MEATHGWHMHSNLESVTSACTRQGAGGAPSCMAMFNGACSRPQTTQGAMQRGVCVCGPAGNHARRDLQAEHYACRPRSGCSNAGSCLASCVARTRVPAVGSPTRRSAGVHTCTLQRSSACRILPPESCCCHLEAAATPSSRGQGAGRPMAARRLLVLRRPCSRPLSSRGATSVDAKDTGTFRWPCRQVSLIECSQVQGTLSQGSPYIYRLYTTDQILEDRCKRRYTQASPGDGRS